MITPDQVGQRTLSTRYVDDMATLEKRCDEAIREADGVMLWPARVRTIRQQICPEAIRDTASKYEAAGWVVLHGIPGSGIYMTIDRPIDRPATGDPRA